MFSCPPAITTSLSPVATACAASMTASYTVIDAAGVRTSGQLFIYLGWFFVLSGVTILPTAILRRGRRFLSIARQETRPALMCMGFNLTTYGLALYAYANAPVAPMAALRELSIVLGAILAALVLKEPFGARRTLLAICLAAGLVLLQVM